MAEIVLLNLDGSWRIFNAGSGDIAGAHNTSVTNLNNELATKLPKAGGTMSGDINMDSHKITNLPAPTASAEPARKTDVDVKVSKAGDTMSGNLAMGSNKITGLAAATANGDATRYEDVVKKAGDTMSGNLAMGSNKITGLAAATANGDATRYEDVVKKAGDTMSGNLAMGGNKVTGLAAASANGDALRYEDVRRKVYLLVLLKSTTNSISIGSVQFPYSNSGIMAPGSGCITGIWVTNTDGSKEVKTRAYIASGTAAQGRFSDGSEINFYRSTSTGANNPIIDGVAVTSAGLDTFSVITETSDNALLIELTMDVLDAA